MITRIVAAAIIAIAMLASAACSGARANPPKTVAVSFEQYVAQREGEIRKEESSTDSFLSIPSGERSAAEAQLRRGEILINKQGDSPVTLPGALIHNWVGLAFIPGATISEVLRVVQDYDGLSRYYAPAVVSSKLLSRDGNDFRVALRLRGHKVITVVLDTEYTVHYGQLDAGHQYSVSRSTRVAEIADAGKPGEHPVAPGDDHGFLRQLNTYWRFVRAADGVFVQCEAISMTRDVPAGLGWLVNPFLESIPRDELHFTLINTRNAVLQKKRSQVSNEPKSQVLPAKA